MPWIKLGDSYAHVRIAQKPRRRCSFCNTGWVEKLCDFPLGRARTCSKGMCNRCATPSGPDLDYCPNHRGRQPMQGSLQLQIGDDHA